MNLLKSVQHSLGRIKPPSNGEITSEQTLHYFIKKSLVDLDHSISQDVEDASENNLPLQENVWMFAPAFACSCALSLYDPLMGRLHVACAGDSRVVLGQSSPEGKWEAVPLSVDQTGSNEATVARLNSKHPGEEGIALDDRGYWGLPFPGPLGKGDGSSHRTKRKTSAGGSAYPELCRQDIISKRHRISRRSRS